MSHLTPFHQQQRGDSGFSLPELLVSLLVLSVIVGTVTQLSMTMSNGQRTMWNRTQMHSSVRGAISLLQQEVGQAGLVALPGTVTPTCRLRQGRALTAACPSRCTRGPAGQRAQARRRHPSP